MPNDRTAERRAILGAGAFLGAALLSGQASAAPGDGGDDGGSGGGQGQTHEFVLKSASTQGVSYTLTVASEPRKVTDGSDMAAEGNDTVLERSDMDAWDIQGSTGSASGNVAYGDTFRWESDHDDAGILGFRASLPSSEYTMTVNDVVVNPDELPAYTPPTTDENGSDGGSDGNGGQTGRVPLGGGAGYQDTFTATDADVNVTTENALRSALRSAGSGDVVFVGGGSTIRLSDTVTVPAGAVLASNRGVSGSGGGMIEVPNDGIDPAIMVHGSGRVTGLQIKGPHPGWDLSGSAYPEAIFCDGRGEVDNCDIWGMGYAGVKTEGSGADAHIHHNVIREINRGGLGYGITAQANSNPTIEYNYFNANRHSIAGEGGNYGYIARYNHFGPDLTDTHIDIHPPGAVRTEIHNNVVEGYRPTHSDRFEGDVHQAVQVRGVPEEICSIHENWFWNPNLPIPGTWGGANSPAIIQPESETWENVDFSGNFYGEDAETSFGGIIPGYDGWRSA